MYKDCDWDDVLDRAKTGEVSRNEVNRAIQVLSGESNPEEEDLYVVLFIVGLASSPEESGDLVRWYLLHDEDPMMVGLALRILGKWWSRASDWLDTIQSYLDWQEWDEEQDVRLAACSVASDYLRIGKSAPVLQSLINVARGDNADVNMCEHATNCLARALGYSYRQLAGLDGDDNQPSTQRIIDEANKRLALEKSSSK